MLNSQAEFIGTADEVTPSDPLTESNSMAPLIVTNDLKTKVGMAVRLAPRAWGTKKRKRRDARETKASRFLGDGNSDDAFHMHVRKRLSTLASARCWSGK